MMISKIDSLKCQMLHVDGTTDNSSIYYSIESITFVLNHDHLYM